MADKAPSRSPPPFPEKVGKYELLLPIGTGGMATVYLARSRGVGGFERDVALKLVHAHLRTDEDSKLQLLEEAKLAARIRHPNVVPVLEVDEDPLGLFLVMDYVEGDTLSGLVRISRAANRALSLPLIGRILNDALLGLHAAHELVGDYGKSLNLVHRDFSPQNILVSIEGITRLADFGVAKAADRAVRTKTGLVKGKISYMSPEQARGQAIDRRCDVWAAGVVAWELIAGRRMHRSDDDVATLLSIVTEEPPRLHSVLPNVPKALDDAVAWALTPEVAKRCPTAEELRKALAKAFEEHEGMADAQELGRFVRQTMGPKLEERKASVSEVRTLRRRMDELARSRTDEPSDAEASQEPPKPQTTLKTGVVGVPLAPADGRELQRSPNSLSPARFGGGSISGAERINSPSGLPGADPWESAPVSSLAREELTQNSAVVPLFEAVRRDRKRLIVGAIAVLGLLTALGLALSETLQEPDERDSAERSAALPSVSPSASPKEAAAASGDVQKEDAQKEGAQKGDPPEEDRPPALEETSAPTSPVNAAPASEEEKPRRPPRRPPPTSEPAATSRHGKPKLADSPYAAPKPGE